MNKTAVNDYLVEYSKKEFPEMIQRELKIQHDKKFATALIGPRRSGKTYYLFQLMKEEGASESLYLNFEDTRLLDLDFKDIREVIRLHTELSGKIPKNLFLDEIQNISRWEAAVRELYDTHKYHIYLTGSSSKLLSKEIATQMRGRSLTYLFLPFSFGEYLKVRNFSTTKMSRDDISILKHHLRDYLEFGGFPDVVISQQKEKILKEYFDAILYKDVVERHNVKNLHLVNLIFKQLVNSFSKEFSVNALYQNFKSQGAKVSRDTIYKYINYFEDSVSVFMLKRHSEKLRQKEAWPRKVYLSDTGFSKVIKSSEDVGRLMENIVFLELIRRKNTKPLLEISYYKDTQGREVDFVLKEAGKITELIQVTYAIDPADIRKTETKNMAMASKKLNCEKQTVITWDYEADQENIRYTPLWKWLLTEE